MCVLLASQGMLVKCRGGLGPGSPAGDLCFHGCAVLCLASWDPAEGPGWVLGQGLCGSWSLEGGAWAHGVARK